MTEPQTDSSPPKAEAKFLPILLVPIAAGVWLASRTAYYEGFAKSLGIPDSLSVTPGIIVSTAIFEFTFIFMLLNGAIVLSQSFGLVKLAKHPVVENLLATIFLTVFFGLGGLLVLLKQWPSPFGSGFGILLLVLCALFWWLIWLHPLSAHADVDGYLPKLRREQEEHRKRSAKIADDENEPWDLTNLVHSLGGRSAALMLMAFILVPMAGYYLGRYVGGDRTEWLVVESPEIPSDVASGTWIVLGEKGDRILVAPTQDGLIINHYRLVDASSATFHRQELGELEPEEVSETPEKE